MSKVAGQNVAESTKMESGVLVGRFDHNLDPKKRFTIPSEWRAVLGDPAYVYVMPDRRERCLNLIPQAEMEARLEELRKKALLDPALNAAYQTIGAMSDLLPLDGQGRIRVSDKLLQFANLTTTVAMVGSIRMVKLWDPKALAPAEVVDQAALDAALDVAGF
ncbi:MAG: division/cell wall cluster transcriptional repressor MraZ [Kiritimatiellia bacterium]